MKRIEPCSTLDETISVLLKAKENDEEVYCEFNGHTLYSKIITEDYAYKLVLGKTKKEIEKERLLDENKTLEQSKEREEKCNSLVPMFIKRGKKVIFPEKHVHWEQFVKSNKYMPNILEVALIIMEKLDSGCSVEDVSNILIEKRDTIYPAMVAKIVYKFSPYGAHFYQDYNCVINPDKSYYEWKMLESENVKNINLGRKYGKNIPELITGSVAPSHFSLDDILSTLFAAQESGIDIFIMFHGKKLYSSTVTIDGAYLKVYGVTREEYFKPKSKQKKLINKK